MEKYLIDKHLILGIVFTNCCIVILFIVYILELRARFLSMLHLINQLDEAVIVNKDILPSQFLSNFNTLVVAPINMTIRFVSMFVITNKKRHRHAITLLKAFNFDKKMNIIINKQLQITKTSIDFVEFYNTVFNDNYSTSTSNIISELINSDIRYKSKNWKTVV